MKVHSTMQPSPVSVPPELECPIPEERREIINRLVRATGLAEAITRRTGMRVSKSWHPLQINQRQFNDSDFRINAPYGLIGLALNADIPTLKRMCLYCERKKKEFTKLGDYDTARLFGNRQSMISGILNHMTTVSLL